MGSIAGCDEDGHGGPCPYQGEPVANESVRDRFRWCGCVIHARAFV